MKKYFVCSDIHGFYKEWKRDLRKAGYDKNNEEHILIVLGDIFDRGTEPYQIYKFLKSIPVERLILVKGNHEYLLLDLVKRKMPFNHDYQNGTYDTLISLYKNPDHERLMWLERNKEKYVDPAVLYDKGRQVYWKVYKNLFDNKKLNEIVDWLKSPVWRDYYELGKYIFVHSFIPLFTTFDVNQNKEITKYIPNWRHDSTKQMWEDATWGCPYEQYIKGYFDKELQNGKVLVCGHWDTSDFFNHLLYLNERDKWLDVNVDNPIFISEKYPGLIAIDTCTVLTKRVNVLIISENEL